MFLRYRTRGIVLKKQDRGEANQLLTIYTRDFGRLEVLAKGVRKIVSKLRASAELFYLSEIEFIQGKTHKTLTDAVLIDKFALVRSDLVKLRIAHKVADDVCNFIHGQEADPKLWRLLTETFQRLESMSKARLLTDRLVYYFFFWNLVSVLGYEPEISGCMIAGKKINCDVVKIVKVTLRKDWPLLSRLKLTAEHLKLLKSATEWYKVKIQGLIA